MSADPRGAPPGASAGAPGRLSVIVPFHRNLDQLRQCLAAVADAATLLPAPADTELIVVADGSPVDCAETVREAGGRLLSIDGPRGPALARNRGAAHAHGDLLVFVDTDVVIHRETLLQFVRLFEAEPRVTAAFGAYDQAPADPGFFSQCRNLAHSFVHQRSRRDAQTFWAGLGAVRAAAFARLEGFDERFGRPSVEDIDLGYRMRAAGMPIVLDARIQGTHLKRWTLWSSLLSDVLDRGVPWTQLLKRYGAMHDDLNISRRYRACVVVAYLTVFALVGAWFWTPLLGVATLLLGLQWWLDLPYYRFFRRQRGLLFTLRWFPFHVLHHLSNGVSFAAGSALYGVRRWTGLELPGALPLGVWSRANGAGRRESYLAG